MVTDWLGLAVLLGLVEVFTVSMFAGLPALGALVALALASLGFSIWIQAAAFVGVSISGVLVVRPIAQRRMRRTTALHLSGAAAMIGADAVVVDPIGSRFQGGHVRVAGERWPARSRHGEPLPPGAVVRVEQIEGSTLLVVPSDSGPPRGAEERTL